MGMFDLIKTLADADIEYVLVDGLAVALQGYLEKIKRGEDPNV
jgi:hypothetical protein